MNTGFAKPLATRETALAKPRWLNLASISPMDIPSEKNAQRYPGKGRPTPVGSLTAGEEETRDVKHKTRPIKDCAVCVGQSIETHGDYPCLQGMDALTGSSSGLFPSFGIL